MCYLQGLSFITSSYYLMEIGLIFKDSFFFSDNSFKFCVYFRLTVVAFLLGKVIVPH